MALAVAEAFATVEVLVEAFAEVGTSYSESDDELAVAKVSLLP